MTNLTTDQDGFIVQRQADGTLEGGDSVNWTGHAIYLNDGFKSGVHHFRYCFSSLGSYVRYPFVYHEQYRWTSFYKNPWHGNISRDQLTGILASTFVYPSLLHTLGIILHHGAWLWLFSYNTIHNSDSTYKWKWPDFTGPSIWALEVRSLANCLGPLGWVFWPVLSILDLHMLLATLWFNKRQESNDVISFTIKAMIGREKYPTIFSYFAWRLLDKKKVLRLLHDYWCGWRENCGMYDLYEKKIEELG